MILKVDLDLSDATKHFYTRMTNIYTNSTVLKCDREKSLFFHDPTFSRDTGLADLTIYGAC